MRPKRHGLGELDDGDRDAGQRQDDRQAALGQEQRDGAAIGFERGHRRRALRNPR
jgi:hypothetical protein